MTWVVRCGSDQANSEANFIGYFDMETSCLTPNLILVKLILLNESRDNFCGWRGGETRSENIKKKDKYVCVRTKEGREATSEN